MSLEAGHLSGGASIYLRYPIRASIATAGIPIISVTDTVGVAPATTTSADDAVGLGLDTSTYSTTQADLDDGEAGGAGAYRSYSGLDMGRMVTVSVRPDLIIKSLMSNGATEGTALQLLINTSASAGGTVVSDTDASANDLTGGTIWCISGNNVGHARQISSDTASTSVTVTVPFPRTIAVGDTFLECPYAGFGTGASAIDGANFLQFTTLISQADASIASGTGAEVQVFKMELNGASDSYVLYILRQHQFNRHTVPS